MLAVKRENADCFAGLPFLLLPHLKQARLSASRALGLGRAWGGRPPALANTNKRRCPLSPSTRALLLAVEKARTRSTRPHRSV